MVEGARLFGIYDMAFVEEVVVTKLRKATKVASLVVGPWNFDSSGMYLVAKEASRDVNLFAPDNVNFLSVEDLLGNY